MTMVSTRVVGSAAIAAAAWLATPAHADPVSARALLDKYCVGCHNQRTANGGISFDGADVASVAGHPEMWERVIRKVRLGAMPPRGLPRPDAPAAAALVSYLQSEIDRAAAARPNPGRVETFHRLNRAEYQNAVRDLFGVDVDVAALLPADDSDKHGFDNVGSTLSVSPVLLERYIAAAKKISRLAVGIAPAGGDSVTYTGFPRELEDDRTLASDDLPFGSRGGLAVRHHFPADGEYTIGVKLRRTRYDYVMGLGYAHQLQIRVDGALAKSFTIGGDQAPGPAAPLGFSGNLAGDPKWEAYAIRGVDADMQARIRVTAGPHVIGLSFVARPTEEEGVKLRDSDITAVPEADDLFFTNPNVATVRVEGPLTSAPPSDSATRRLLFVCRPTGGNDARCAKRILAAVARRAYRRPVTAAEVETLLEFFRAGWEDASTELGTSGSFDTGIALAVQRVLVDPNFLFRIEREPSSIAPNTNYRISDVELASRLSFFLWSSLPDDELLDAAMRGRLRKPAVLARQARRMFGDARSRALVENFAGQWLQLRNIASVKPDARLFPEFDEVLRQALRRETELFLEDAMREDRSLPELLTANYTFLNERLARHYGIPGVYGERFRRVALPDSTQRGGLLGQASLLTLTSYPTRTSPVLRGRWLLENILGAPPPPPPPDAPGLPDRDENGKAASVRERLEQHRRNPVCAACHAQMDPLGFALEHFDGTGKWRTAAEGGRPVDASGAYVNGAEFAGLAGLRTFVLDNREAFVETFIQKLLAYALGREIEVYDLPTVRRIQQQAGARDYRWSAVIEGIVTSPAFVMRRSAE